MIHFCAVGLARARRDSARVVRVCACVRVFRYGILKHGLSSRTVSSGQRKINSPPRPGRGGI